MNQFAIITFFTRFKAGRWQRQRGLDTSFVNRSCHKAKESLQKGGFSL